MVQTSSSTTDEVCIHNNRTVPMGKHESCFSRCFRDSLQEREAGIRGTPRLKVWGEQTEQSNCWWRQRGGGAVGESPRTWNIDGSRQVYFCPPDRLPGALSDGQLLYCLTRKGIKKAKGREGRRREAGGAGLGAFHPAGCALPRGWGAFRSRDVMKPHRRTGRFLDCVLQTYYLFNILSFILLFWKSPVF